MSSSFEDLIKKFGVPKIVIPNTQQIQYLTGGCIATSNNPEIDVQSKIYHRRFKYGDTEFLAVSSRYETWISNEKRLLEYLQEQNLKPVEFNYRYKGARTWDYSTDSWKESKVAIATDQDIETLSLGICSKPLKKKEFYGFAAGVRWATNTLIFISARPNFCQKITVIIFFSTRRAV